MSQRNFMRNFILLKMYCEQKNNCTVIQEKGDNRNSNSTTNTEEECYTFQTILSTNTELQCCSFIKNFLSSSSTSASVQQKVSKKINKSAIGWLQAQGVLKNIDVEIIALASSLYYCWVHFRKLEKSQLQPILITCLYLSCKFLNGPTPTISSALQLVNTVYPIETILSLQSQILQLLQFNLLIPTTYNTHILQYQSQPQIYNKICFYFELLLLKNHNILFDVNKVEEIINMEKQNIQNKDGSYQWKEENHVYWEICTCLQYKQAENLMNKYRGKFDVDQLVKQFGK